MSAVENIDATLQRERASKYDKNLEREIINWINSTIRSAENTPETVVIDETKSFQENLKDGSILCRLV